MDEESKISILGNGITTRMLERRLTLELDMNKRNSDLKATNQKGKVGVNNIDYKFLQGASIPNSVARKSLQPKVEENKPKRTHRNRSFDMPQESIAEEREKFNQSLTTSLKELRRVYLEAEKPTQSSNTSNETSYGLWEKMKTKRNIFNTLIPKMSTIEEKSIDTTINTSPQKSSQGTSLKTLKGSKISSKESSKLSLKMNLDAKSNTSQEYKDNIGPLKPFSKTLTKRKDSSGRKKKWVYKKAPRYY